MLRYSQLVLLVLAAALQAQPTPPFTCSATSEPRPIRSEGTTELVGDVILRCSGAAIPAPGTLLPGMNITLKTSPAIGITSPLSPVPGANHLTEALAFLEEPTPGVQTLCGSPAVPFTGGPGICSGVAGAAGANAFRGFRDASPSSLTWIELPVNPPGTAGIRIIRLTNLRVNASQVGLGSPDSLQVRFLVSATLNGAEVPIAGPSPTAAVASNGMHFSISGFRDCQQCTSVNRDFAANPVTGSQPCDQPLQLRYAESFPTMFRRRNQARPTPPSTDTVPEPVSQDVLGFPYQSESGFYKKPDGTRWDTLVGLADTGTLLVARFGNVQAGVQIYVPRKSENGSLIVRTITTASPVGNYVPVSLIPNASGERDGQVEFEVLDANDSTLDAINIPVVFSWSTSSPSNPPALGTSSVYGNAGPFENFAASGPSQLSGGLNRAVLAEDKLTVPRFADDTVGVAGRRGQAMLTVVSCENPNQIRPQLAVTTGALPVQFTQQGNTPDPFQFYLLTEGASITGVNVESTTSWLRVEKNGSTTPTTITINVDPAGLAPGSHSGTFRITGNGINPASVTIPLNVSPPGPHLTRWGVTNTASYEANVAAAGEAMTFFGERFGPDSLVTAQFVDGKLAATLGETRVLFDGVAAPMIYAARGQVSAIAPFALAGKKFTTVQIEYRGVASPGVRIPVVPAVPGLLTADSSGTGKAAALNQDNTFNSVIGALPNEYVVFFGVGGPNTQPAGRDGELYSAPLPTFTGRVSVLLDGVEVPAADVAYVGPAPGQVHGVWQANVRLPANAPRNGRMQIQLRFGDYVTQPGVTVSVR